MLAGEFKEHAKGCPQDPTARKLEGCDEDKPIPTFIVDGQSFYRCPLFYIDAGVLETIQLWKWSRKGHLPEPGGVLDQPMKLMESIDVLDSAFEQQLAEKHGQ